jgi:rod shape-determining protein MreD
MNKETLKDLLVGLSFVIVEVLIFQHLSFFGASPDPLLIYLLWLSMKYDRLQIVIITAVLAFFQDALFDFWGLNMFSKILLIFFTYNFLNRQRESRLLVWQVFLVILVTAGFHNIIFLGLSSFIEAYSSGFSPIIFLLLSSLYTATLGSMLFIFKGN